MFGRIKIGIMGTGRMAGIMADTIKDVKGAVCYAVGSRSIDTANSFASAHGIKKSYGSYAELVSDPKIDLIYIVEDGFVHRFYSAAYPNLTAEQLCLISASRRIASSLDG